MWNVLINPFYELFKKGPSILGGYSGLPDIDICTQITNVPSYIWEQNSTECNSIIQRKFQSLNIVIFVILYLFSIYKFFSYLCFRYFILKPFVNEIKLAIEHK